MKVQLPSNLQSTVLDLASSITQMEGDPLLSSQCLAPTSLVPKHSEGGGMSGTLFAHVHLISEISWKIVYFT